MSFDTNFGKRSQRHHQTTNRAAGQDETMYAVKFILASYFTFALMALAQADWTLAADADYQIVPGKRIGKVHLGDRREAVRAILGKPFHSRWDERLELRTDIWRSPDKERPKSFHYLFVVYEKDRVADIHITSPRFRTDRKICMNSDYEETCLAYKLGKDNCYAIFNTERQCLDYESKHDGITFTFAGGGSGPMIRIAVFPRKTVKRIGYSDGDDWYWYPDWFFE